MIKKYDYLVAVQCMTYNHSKYITDALNGFVKQNTNFPFVILLVDDASTDGEEKVISDYVNTNFNSSNNTIAYKKETEYATITYAQHKTNNNCFIVTMFLKYNHYQIGRKLDKLKYLEEWINNSKYIALCEGDDYWIDPYKLQKQVDILEKNTEYTMCCSDAVIQTNNGVLDWCRYQQNQNVKIEDIIINGGWFLQTATLIYRKDLLINYPSYCQKCHVGDYPLMLWAGLKSKIFWIAEKQVVYRYSIGNSWTSTYNKQALSIKIKGWRSEIDMLQGLDKYSNSKYHYYFIRRQVDFVRNILLANQHHYKECSSYFEDVKKFYTTKEKLVDYLIKLHLYNPLCKIKAFIKWK